MLQGKITERLDYSYDSKHELWGRSKSNHQLQLKDITIWTSELFATHFSIKPDIIKILKDDEMAVILLDNRHHYGISRNLLVAFCNTEGKYVLTVIKELYPEDV